MGGMLLISILPFGSVDRDVLGFSTTHHYSVYNFPGGTGAWAFLGLMLAGEVVFRPNPKKEAGQNLTAQVDEKRTAAS